MIPDKKNTNLEINLPEQHEIITDELKLGGRFEEFIKKQKQDYYLNGERKQNFSDYAKKKLISHFKLICSSYGTSLGQLKLDNKIKDKGETSKLTKRLNYFLNDYSRNIGVDPEHPIQVFSSHEEKPGIRKERGLHLTCAKSGIYRNNQSYSWDNITLEEAKIKGKLKTSQKIEQQQVLPSFKSSEKTLTNEDKKKYIFSNLADNLRHIDNDILRSVRSLNTKKDDNSFLEESEIHQIHQALVNQYLIRKDLSTNVLIRILHDKECMVNILNNLPEPSINVKVADDFSKLSYICSPEKVLEVKSPELFWDCHCDVREKDKHLFNFICPIDSQTPLNNEVRSLFYNYYVQIHYRGLRFYWRRGNELWPPSVDTYGMINDLEKEGVFEKRCLSVLDIGSGTGLLGITIAHHNPNIIKMDLSDWLLTPLLYGLVNWEINKPDGRHIDVKGRLDYLTCGRQRHEKLYDLVVCNPPYLPLLSEHKSLGLESSVAGTDLLEHVIKNSRTLGKNIYIQFSDLALKEAQIAAKEASVNLKQIGTKRNTPFRLRTTWGKKDYIETLKSRGLEDDPNKRHRYYHTVRTYHIEQ